MITLRPVNLHWLGGWSDSADLCAHGGVDLRCGEDKLVDPSHTWSVSAAALYLLRTLSQPHLFAKNDVSEQPLFPCCGHGMFEDETSDDVILIGCPNGADIEVVASHDMFQLSTADGQTYQVSASHWKGAVCHFSDAVEAFYEMSPPRTFEGGPDDIERRGYERFRAEWARRRAQAG